MAKKVEWEFTDEHKKQVPAWVEKWTQVAFSTEPVDREKCTEAIRGMYTVAKLDTEDFRVVYVPSLLVGVYAYAAAAAIWYFRTPDGAKYAKKLCESAISTAGPGTEIGKATNEAIQEATDAATADATLDATVSAALDDTVTATWVATDAATNEAIRRATNEATRAATWAATWVATANATRDATQRATNAATRRATEAVTVAAAEAATADATEAATRRATHGATWSATDAATWVATQRATRVATEAATWEATRDATNAATRAAAWEATWRATEAATDAATWVATQRATRVATWVATANATRDATGRATAAATEDATEAATRRATDAATNEAIRRATNEAIRRATNAATRAATGRATWAATEDAAEVATRFATTAATWRATADATDAATADATADATAAFANTARQAPNSSALAFMFQLVSSFLARVVEQVWRTRNGGNEWAGYCSYLSFVRDVVGWSCPEHEQYVHYENATLYGGVRFMHEKFCIVVDRPCEIHLDDNNRLHNENGMARKYRDGTGLWYINGVAVTEQIVMHPETLTVEQIREIENEEVKRIAIERFGWERYLSETNAKVVNFRVNEIEQTREALMSADGMRVLVCACPSTARVYALEVPEDIDSCEEAQRWLAADDIFGKSYCVGRT